MRKLRLEESELPKATQLVNGTVELNSNSRASKLVLLAQILTSLVKSAQLREGTYRMGEAKRR